MFTETQLSVIKTFGRKDISEGCKVRFGEKIITVGTMDDEYYSSKIPDEIIGHEVHLEDLFRVAEEKGFGVICYRDGLEIYMWEGEEDESMKSIDYNPTISLLDQPESTLKELLALFN